MEIKLYTSGVSLGLARSPQSKTNKIRNRAPKPRPTSPQGRQSRLIPPHPPASTFPSPLTTPRGLAGLLRPSRRSFPRAHPGELRDAFAPRSSAISSTQTSGGAEARPRQRRQEIASCPLLLTQLLEPKLLRGH